MANFSAWILPVIVIFIILHGLAHGVKVFDCFLEGAKRVSTRFVLCLPHW